jgi:chromate transporter
VVIQAVLRIGRRALKTRLLVGITAAAFAGIFFFALPFPLIIAVAALIGFAAARAGSAAVTNQGHGAAQAEKNGPVPAIDALFANGSPQHIRPSARRLLKTTAVGVAVWLGPLLALFLVLGPANVFVTVGAFMSKMAVVTFGGAYAVLAYMAQQAVERYHWLTANEMLVGLGFAETTPGPLISVVQFVGFMAAFRQPGPLDPFVAGTLGGIVAMWFTFVPSFVWVFVGAPYAEAVLGNRALSGALSAITAAVVGVVLNLAVWFALHSLFGRVVDVGVWPLALQLPVLGSVNWPAIVLSAAAALAIFRFKLGMLWVFAICCTASLMFYFVQQA